MGEHRALAEEFEANRRHLQSVAQRMLGSTSEADDAVQEGWLRLSRSDTSDVANLRGWLTTVVARVCLDMLRSRKSRREESLDARVSELIVRPDAGMNPEREAVIADSVGLALLVVLETLTPAERVAFVLHDMFDLSFDEIAPIVGRSPTAARQLASRARRRVQGAESAPAADHARRRKIVDAFLAASRSGNFEALRPARTVEGPGRASPRRRGGRKDGGREASGRRTKARPGAPWRSGGSGKPLRSRGRRPTCPHQWRTRTRLGAWWPAARRLQLHDRSRQDRQSRPHRGPRAPPPPRPHAQLTSHLLPLSSNQPSTLAAPHRGDA